MSLEKTVNNSNPSNGDIITFTLTLINSGPDTATNVAVTDVLPGGLIYLNASATHGYYDDSTGIWYVGTVLIGESAELTLMAEVNVSQIVINSINLGVATNYNVFILRDIDQPSSDTQGKMAAGRDVHLANYSIGDALPNSNGTEDVLIVGNDLNFESGAVYGGNVVFGHNTNLPSPLVSILNGTLRQDNVIDFSAAQNYLSGLSISLAGFPVNGSTIFEYGGLFLTGSDPVLNVFQVNGSDLSIANNFEINVPNGSVVLVNINGAVVSWSGGLSVVGTSLENVIYNFHHANSITIQNIDIRGSILAPIAVVNFISGVQNGQMIAKKLLGQGQFNNVSFLGNLPQDTTIINIAEVSASDQNDPDSTPNNGVPSEDDYASTILHIGIDSTQVTANWQFVGNFTNGQIIWNLYRFNDNLFAGTIGGRIYKSTDDGLNWTIINESMNVGFVWDILSVDENSIYAATEHGLYSSTDGGAVWNLSAIDNNDIRSIDKDLQNNLYAASWGGGVFRSTNHGTTWENINNGLTCLAVHAICADTINNKIFLGTFGGGVFASGDEGNYWEQLNVGYDYIWSIAITDNIIFAGTYGNGLFRSEDNGSTWERLTAGLPAQYIYSINIDDQNNVYLSTWANGVYASSDWGESWTFLGFGGVGISTILADNNTGKIFAASTDGNLYSKSLVTTESENPDTKINDFELYQNYPNPFNPTTSIEFSIVRSDYYTLRVYNLLGEEIKELIRGYLTAGHHKLTFSAENLPSGVYFYQLKSHNIKISRKMVLLK